MKTKIIPFISTLILFVFLFSSCNEPVYKIYTGYSPVFMTYEELRASVYTEQDVDLVNPGKIYFKDDYIFIIEEMKGIHVFNNTNPVSPVKTTFVKIPGVVDISISGNILYADSYIDLVVLDVQDINNIHEVARMEDFLPYTVPPANNDYPSAWVDQDKGVVIGWEVKKIKEEEHNYYEPMPVFRADKDYYQLINATGVSSGISGSGVGAGGSMARFGIKGNVLYVLSEYRFNVFDISVKTSPQYTGEIYTGTLVETMFLTDKYMFIGSTIGMAIYDLSVPLTPQFLSIFSHAQYCDPVIVDDTLAYITLRTGTNCGGSINQLNVINIKDILIPKLVMSYALTNPYGLGKDGDILFVCDGSAGLKIFDASDPRTITGQLIKAYPGIHAYDVIPMNGILILIGADGLYQYDYSDLQNISLLSSILVSK